MMKLFYNGEYTMLPIANQIAQTEDLTTDWLTEYTNEQLLLAEENSVEVETSSRNSQVYVKYIFEDKSKLYFLITPVTKK